MAKQSPMTMDIDTALHELLLTRPVTEDDIVQAHRRMAMRFHPDKAVDPDEKRWVQQRFVQLQEAYKLLKGLPIDTINAPSDRSMSEESCGRSAEQPAVTKPCPFCGEQIQVEAIKCRHCRRFLKTLHAKCWESEEVRTMGSRVSGVLAGIMLGIILGIGGSYWIGQRYVITKEPGTLQTKMDRWTGKTWVMRRYVDEKGNYVSSFWEPVSQKP